MLKHNKWKVLLSSFILLLPVFAGLILWNRLPDSMSMHWGADGHADGSGPKALVVFGMPLILLALHLLCLFVTSFDSRQKGQSKKALGIIFWIIPMTSLFANGVVYSAALGKPYNPTAGIPLLLGAMFLLIGNYLPKIKQNRTLGIRISWTLNNEENWNLTHRFAGKLWVIGGFILVFSVFLPKAWMIPLSVGVILLAVLCPALYSYRIYQKHQREGVAYQPHPKSKLETYASRILAVVLPILLLGTALLMFTGKITVQCGETSLLIEASYWNDLEVDYSAISHIEYREKLDVGTRTAGFGSARLSMGTFENDAFGSYTLYAYTGVDEYLVLTVDERILVIGTNDSAQTKALYETLTKRIQSH